MKLLSIWLIAGALVGTLVPIRRSAPAPAPALETVKVVRAELQRPEEAPPLTVADAIQQAKTSPQAFLKKLLEADPQPSEKVIAAFFQTWIAQDPEAAFGAAMRLPLRFGFGPDNLFFMRELTKLYSRDAAMAFRLVGQVEGVIGGGFVAMTVSQRLGELSPAEVRDRLNAAPPASTLVLMGASYMRYLCKERPAMALGWFKSLGHDQQLAILPQVADVLARCDRDAALEFLRDSPSEFRQAGFGLLGGMEDPAVALEFVEETMGQRSISGVNNLLGELVRKDPEKAAAYVNAIPYDDERLVAVGALSESYTLYQPTGNAVAWLMELPDEMRITAARSSMMMRMPEHVLEYLAPLQAAQLSPVARAEYARTVAAFLDGEQARSFGRNASTGPAENHFAVIGRWLRENSSAGRDEFFEAAIPILRKDERLRDLMLPHLSPDDAARLAPAE